MPNPIEQVVALAKKGDRRVLLGGAAVIGGGVGLFVYLNKRATGSAPVGIPQPGATESGGESGGGGGSDLESLLDQTAPELQLPQLPEAMPASDSLYADTAAPNFANTEPISLPELAGITASPLLSGYDFETTLPTLSQLPSYTGAVYGNDIGGADATLPGSSGSLQAFRPETTTPVTTTPQIVQSTISREIAAETYQPVVISQPVASREIAADVYRPPAREVSTAVSARTAIADVYQAPYTPPRQIQADVYIPGQGAVLGGIHETFSDYQARAANLMQQANLARQVEVAQAVARTSNLGVYTPSVAAPRQTYQPPTAQTARAETYTPPARTVAAETYTAKARETAQPSAARTTIIKPDSALARLR